MQPIPLWQRPWFLGAVQIAALLVLLAQWQTMSHLTIVGVKEGRGWGYILQPAVDDRLYDFYQEWASARNWHVGLPIYTRHEDSLPRHLGIDKATLRWHGLDYNAHPPVSVVLVLPLGALGYLDALLVWHGLMTLCLLASAVLVCREYRLWPSRIWWPWVLPTLALLTFWVPLRDQYLQGQLTPLLLLLLTGAWVCGRRGAGSGAGVLLGVAAAIKLFPAFLLLYFVLRKQWRAVVVAGIVFGSLTGLSLLLFDVTTYQQYVSNVLPSLTVFRSSGENQSIVGFWYRLFVGAPTMATPLTNAPALAWVGIVSTAAVLIGTVVWRLRRATTPSQYDRGYWLLVTVMVLLGPLTWIHSPLLLTLPLVYLGVDLRHRSTRTWSSWLVIPLVLFQFYDLRVTRAFVSATDIVTPMASLTYVSLPCYALLLLFLASSRSLRLKGDAAPSTTQATTGQTARIRTADAIVL